MEFKLTERQVIMILSALDVMADQTTAPDLVLAIHDARAAVALQLREAVEKEVTNG